MKIWLVWLTWLISVQYGRGQDNFVEGKPRLAFWKIGHRRQIVIVLHGGPDATHQYLRPELDGLSQAATVIYYDQRGMGHSEPATSYSWPLQIADLDRVIRRFSSGKVFLVASSFGTTLAILYTYLHPEKIKGLILSGTYQWEGQGMDLGQYQAYKHRLDSLTNRDSPSSTKLSLSREVKHPIYEQRPIRDPKEIKRRGYSTLTVTKEVVRGGRCDVAELRYSIVTAPILDSLVTIKTPVLLFKGSWPDCPIDWAHRYVKVFPHASLVTIEAACHDPWLSDPKTFCAQSTAFINRVVKADN